MKRIAVANRKGGTGKSTTAVHLAAGLLCLGVASVCSAQPEPTAEEIVLRLVEIEAISDRGDRLELYARYVQELTIIFEIDNPMMDDPEQQELQTIMDEFAPITSLADPSLTAEERERIDKVLGGRGGTEALAIATINADREQASGEIRHGQREQAYEAALRQT